MPTIAREARFSKTYGLLRLKMVDLGSPIRCGNITFIDSLLRLRMADLGPHLGADMRHLSVGNGQIRTGVLMRKCNIWRLRMADLAQSTWQLRHLSVGNGRFIPIDLARKCNSWRPPATVGMAHLGRSIWCKMQYSATAFYGSK